MSDTITNDKLGLEEAGLLVVSNDSENAVEPGRLGENYVPYGNCYGRASERYAIAQPTVIGQVAELDDGRPDLAIANVIIKKPNSNEVGLPKTLGFLLPTALGVLEDARQLMGPDMYAGCNVGLIVKRADCKPAQAHIDMFSHWHDHTRNSKPLDLLYSVSNVLATPFRIDGEAFVPPDLSVVRFGTEIVHRSPTNLTQDPLRRTFAIFMVAHGDAPVYSRHKHIEAPNPAFRLSDDTSRHAFRDAAADVLASGRYAFSRHVKPAALTELKGAEAPYIHALG